jgi:PLP dependent protein
MPMLSLENKQILAHNLYKIRDEIARACARYMRKPNDVKLIAVSKGYDFLNIVYAYHLGQRDFGESYAKEFEVKRKMAESCGFNDIKWHFIGAIQSNKLNIIKKADFIHSVGTIRHAHLLNNVAEKKTLSIFLQVNLSQNSNRQGFLSSEVTFAIKEILCFKKLHIWGLMTILPLHEAKEVGYWFKKMLALKKKIIKEGILEQVNLSMGMSNDFIEAIHYGADFLRIGTKIFGPRS